MHRRRLLPRPWASLAAIGIASLSWGCFGSLPIAPAKQIVTGSVHAEGPTFGTVDVIPRSCVSGQRQIFMGADLEDPESGITMRLLIDPSTGPALRLFRSAEPFGPAILLPRSACRKFSMSLERTGWRINNVYDQKVSLEFDCTSAAGDGVSGKLEAPSCH